MRLSNTELLTNKMKDLDEMFPAQDILLQSRQLYQYASGVFGMGHIILGVKQNLENILRDVFKRHGIIELSLPVLQPKSIWEESGRWKQYIDDGVMLYTESNKGTFALGPTAEEAIIKFFKNNLNSHKQMPIIYYQIGEKFRNELRNRGYLMRGKAFTMMDAYSFDTDQASLDKSYDRVRDAYLEFFDILNFNIVPVIADNGAMGGKKSEEIMFISPTGEDTILYNKEKNIGLNTEVLEKENYMTYLKEEYGLDNLDNFVETRAIEIGHIFSLGTHYSDIMDFKFTDIDEKQKSIYMGCYGIGITRLLATIYENSLTENKKGISLPPLLAPYIGQIIYSDSRKEEAEELYDFLNKQGLPCIIDDRVDKKLSFGNKIKDVNILGTPFALILGDKQEIGNIEIENTMTKEKHILTKEELVDFLNNVK